MGLLTVSKLWVSFSQDGHCRRLIKNTSQAEYSILSYVSSINYICQHHPSKNLLLKAPLVGLDPLGSTPHFQTIYFGG